MSTLTQLARELSGTLRAAPSPQPFDMAGAFSQGGMIYGINPQTGQPERVFTLPDPEQGIQFFLESDAPSGAVPTPEGQESDLDDLVKNVATLGLGSAAFGVGGATGASPFTGMDPQNALLLDAAGLALAPAAAATTAATGLGTVGAGEIATGASDAVLAGGAGTDALATMPAAVPETAASLSNMGLVETAPGVFTAAGAAGAAPIVSNFAGPVEGANPVTGATPAGGSGTVNVPGVGAVPASLLGTVASTLLGVYGANQMTDAYSDMAAREDARIREMMGYGAPYRDRLTQHYADPNAFLQSDRVQIPVQQGTDALARSLSMRVGNPALSGTALHELQNYASNQLFSRYGEEADRLAGFGGLTQYNAAAARGPDLGPATNAINAQGGVYNIIGAGIADATRSPRPRQPYLV